ncbi:hypothetical protein CHUAL_007676 [Chamberlinius hualienensis]
MLKFVIVLVVVGAVLVAAQETPGVKSPGADKGPCPVTMNISPVCGTDGKSYTNLSELNCAARDNPGLKVKHTGRCKQ